MDGLLDGNIFRFVQVMGFCTYTEIELVYLS